MQYLDIRKAIAAPGLRLILVQGFPSPWGHAVKAMMEYKGLRYVVGPQIAGGGNPELVAWAGTNSGPVVAWNDEPPVNRWDDILFLLERLAPEKPLVPATAPERVQCFGLAHEICGQLGFGWNRRLDMFRPAMESDAVPEAMASMAAKWRYNARDVAAASTRTAETLRMLADTLKAQQARGCGYFVGDGLSAVDFYWAAFSNLVALLPPDLCPVDPAVRPMFETMSDEVRAALDPILIEHRDRIMRAHFVLPMAL